MTLGPAKRGLCHSYCISWGIPPQGISRYLSSHWPIQVKRSIASLLHHRYDQSWQQIQSLSRQTPNKSYRANHNLDSFFLLFFVIVCRQNKEMNAKKRNVHRSSAHSFSFLICASSSGVKSFVMLKSFRISSGCLPLIMLATDLQPTSSKGLMSK